MSQNLLAAYEADCRLRKMKFYPKRTCYVQEFLEGLNGADPLEVGRLELKTYLAVLQDRGLKQSTIAAAFAGLSGFYEFLTEEGHIAANPVRPFKKRYVRTYKQQVAEDNRQLISVDDASQLVNSILDSRDKAMITLLLKSGMRANELLALDVGDVDMQKFEIRLKPVSKRSNRLLFFDEETAEVLDAWLRARKNRDSLGSPALFLSRRAGRLTINGLEKTVMKHAARIGLHDPKSDLSEKRFFPHACRHWFTTHLYRAGMPERYIAWLRGDAPRGAIGQYIHIDPEDVKRAYLAHVPQLSI